MKEQLSMTEIVNMLLRRWWIIALSAIILGVAAFFYSQFMIAPLYSTDGTIYVNAQRTQSSDISQNNLLASQQLATTYKEILSRRTFLARVSADLDERYSATQLRRMISINSLNETEIMEIRVVGEVPEDVARICNSILTHAPDELIRVVNAGSVKILDQGQVPEAPISPNVKNYTLISFVLGIVLGALIIFAIEFLDTRVKSREDIVSRYEEPILGEIPELVLAPRKEEGYENSYTEKGGKKK